MAKKTEKHSPKRKGEERHESTKDTALKPGLSQKYVVDSDDEDAQQTPKAVKKVTARATPNKRSVKDALKANKPNAPKVRTRPASEESEDDDDDEEEDESSNHSLPEKTIPQKPQQLPAKKNGVKRPADGQSLDESEGQSEDEESDAPAAKKAKTDAADESESASEDDSETREDNRAKKQMPKAIRAPQQANPTTASQTSQSLPAQPFEPPVGYTLLDISDLTTDTALLAQSLEGKQLWHITAPSDVPLSSVTEVALDATESGEPILSHKGADYVLSEESEGRDHESIFLPSKGGYSAAQQHINKSFRLQQKINLPDLSVPRVSQTGGGVPSSDIAQASVRAVRPQPKGLRMRYKPPGFGTGEPSIIGSSDSELEDEGRSGESSFQFPRALGVHGTSNYEREVAASNSAEGEASPKESKKKRKTKERDHVANSSIVKAGKGETHAGVEISHREGASETTLRTPAKKAVMHEGADTPSGSMANGTTPVKLSKEDKAMRKAEKRKKKEANMNAKEVVT